MNKPLPEPPSQCHRYVGKLTTRERGVLPLLLLLSLFCGGPFASAMAQPTFIDTEFLFNQEWSQFGPYYQPLDAGNVAVEAERQNTGGNPGSHLELILTRGTTNSGSSNMWVAFFNNTLVWDPALDADGPFGRIDFSLDARRPEGTADRVITIAIEQDGFVWIATQKRYFLKQSDWTGFSIDCLDALDFFKFPYVNAEGQPTRPDFTENGSPITFGFATGLSCPASSDCSAIVPRELDVDNYAVTVKQASPFFINPGLNDAWGNPATTNQGLYLTVLPDKGLVSMAWFTFDIVYPDQDANFLLGNGGQRWFLTLGSYAGDTASMNVLNFPGNGLFNIAPGEETIIQQYGSADVQWCDCNKAIMSYSLPAYGLSGSIPLTRVADDNVALCEAINAQLVIDNLATQAADE